MSDTETPPATEGAATSPSIVGQLLQGNPLVAVVVVLLGAGGVNVTTSASSIAATQREIAADVERFGAKVDELSERVQALREDRWTRSDMERWQRSDYAPLRRRVEALEREQALLKDRAAR